MHQSPPSNTDRPHGRLTSGVLALLMSLALSSGLAGCATRDGHSTAPEMQTANDWVQWFNRDGQRAFSAYLDPQPTIAQRVEALQERCVSAGAQWFVQSSDIRFQDQDVTGAPVTARLPELLACVRSGVPQWGVQVRVAQPSLTRIRFKEEAITFHGSVDLVYLDASQIAAELHRRALADVQRSVERATCVGREDLAQLALRRRPDVGQETSWGTVIAVRLPQVLLAHNPEQKQRWGTDQRWVPVAELDVVRRCP